MRMMSDYDSSEGLDGSRPTAARSVEWVAIAMSSLRCLRQMRCSLVRLWRQLKAAHFLPGYEEMKRWLAELADIA